MQDEDIIRLILKGDSNQYAVLIDRYSGKVYSTAYNYTHDHEEARDLVQEILIKAFNNLHSFKLEARFSTWLYRIAVNSCIDWSRRRKSKSVITAWSYEDSSILDNLTTEEEGPEEAILKQEYKQLISDAINSIPEIYKTVLILYYFEDQKIQEISSILECPKKTVETRLYRAKGILKAALKEKLSGGGLYELSNL